MSYLAIASIIIACLFVFGLLQMIVALCNAPLAEETDDGFKVIQPGDGDEGTA